MTATVTPLTVRPARMTAPAPAVDPDRTAAMQRVDAAIRDALKRKRLQAVRTDAYPVGGVIVVTGLAEHDVLLRFQGEPGTVVVEQRAREVWTVTATATFTGTTAATLATVALALIGA